ncbi:MAG: hypothetical protein ACRYFV_17660 [Janthinobacterium lividum]
MRLIGPVLGYPRKFSRCEGRHHPLMTLHVIPAALGEQLPCLIEEGLQLA